MTPSELKEKQIAIEASIRTLEEQLETARKHAAALANRKVQEALDEQDNAINYPEDDPINNIDPPATPPEE